MKALLSVYDKTGIVEFSKQAVAAGYELISTGGTHRTLSEEGGLAVQQVADYTGSPEILEGRVKTLRSEERRVGKEGRARWSPEH